MGGCWQSYWKCMNYKALIKKLETGEERLIPIDLDWSGESSEYWWTDGNMGCDCNRERVFEHHNPEIHTKCSEDRFFVPHVLLEDGQLIKIDEEP